MSRRVNGHEAIVLLDRALDDFETDLSEQMFKAMSKAAKLAKREAAARSPERYGDYKKGWAVRTKREKFGCNVLIYNRTYPSLTYLLENGHDVRPDPKNPGKKQRVAGIKHIATARELAEEYLIDALTKEI